MNQPARGRDANPRATPTSRTNRPLPDEKLTPSRSTPRASPVRCNGQARPRFGWSWGRPKLARLGVSLAMLAALAALFVGWEIAERSIFPFTSAEWSGHRLAARVVIATLFVGALAHLVTRRQQRRLSATAAKLAEHLERLQADPSHDVQFENPWLVHCRQVMKCANAQCPMYRSPGRRCWQVMALSRAVWNHQTPVFEIAKCHDCEVYRRSCPDKLTELGESVNNLMFLLRQHAEHVECMRARMVEKEKMATVGELAAGVGHEVGNPLSSISAIVQMLKRQPTNTTVEEQLDLIETQIERIATIVRQLANLVRHGPERWEWVDIDRILEGVIRQITFAGLPPNLTIDFMPASLSPRTYGLTGQLMQVFSNLCANALEAMPSGGTLTIRTRSTGDDIVVTVADTGCGIAPETGRRVFEPFFTTKEPGRGPGLGLTIAHGIVRKHGGTIDFESTPGKGAVFTVVLPITSEKPEP